MHTPELLILYALDMFLVLSIVTVLFDSSFPWAVPYFFQLLSLAGTGHMYVNLVFREMFTLESRFWYSFFYLDAMILSAFAITAYLLFVKKSYAKGLMFSGAYTLPAASFGVYLMTFYDEYETAPTLLRVLNGYWLFAALIISFIIFLKGTTMYLGHDLTFENYGFIIESLRDLVDGLKQPRQEESLPEEPDDDSFNPVDFVHVENPSEIDQENQEH